jgi:uncharacterized protein (DUF1778 family)
LEEKKKQICLRLTEEEKAIIEEKAKAENLTVNAFILKRLLNDSNEIENAIKELSDEVDALKEENRELKQFEKDQREIFSKTLNEMRTTYDLIVTNLKDTIKSNQILIESKESKKGFWSRLFKK